MSEASNEAGRDEGDDNDANPELPALDESMAGDTYTVEVPVTGGEDAAALEGFIDFNGDGVFDEDTESATATVQPGEDSPVALDWTVPDDVAAGETWARFRIGYDLENPTPSGMSDSGEVEDYELTIEPAPDEEEPEPEPPADEPPAPTLPETGPGATSAGVLTGLVTVLVGMALLGVARRRRHA